MEELKLIIKKIKEYEKELGLDFTDDKVLETSGRIFNTKFIQNHRQEKLNKSDSPKDLQSKPKTPATPKQIETLYRLDADFNAETISKQEAYYLLKELLPNKKLKRENNVLKGGLK
jgi:hypothetical protein